MKKVMTKTALAMVLMIAGFAISGCSMGYHTGRDPYMELSTPPAVTPSNPPPKDEDPKTHAEMRDQNMMLSTPPMVQPMVLPVVDQSMLGQPAMAPDTSSMVIDSGMHPHSYPTR